MSSAGDIGVGALEGAAKGAAIAGPAGAIIGGITGAISGLFKSKARKAAKKAAATEKQMDDIQNATIRRNELRAAFIARQTALAAGASETGGTQSSTVQGGVGNLMTQYAYNARYFDTQLANINVYNKYAKKSARYADYAGAVQSVGNALTNVAKYQGWGMPSVAKTIPSPAGTARSTGMGTLGTPNA